MDPLGLFLGSVIDHWQSLMTGGLIIAGIAVYEHWKGEALTWTAFLAVGLLFLIYASYQAWDDEYTKRLAAEAQLAAAQKQLASLSDQESNKHNETMRARVAQLQRFAFTAASLINKTFPEQYRGMVNPTEPVFQQYESEADKWINDTATWILENLGKKAQDRFLDISNTEPNGSGGVETVNQVHLNIVSNLAKYRQNLATIINSIYLYN